MKRLLILGAMLGCSACGGKAIIDGEPTSSTSTTTSSSGGGNMGGGDLESITLDKAFAFVDCFPGGGSGELEVELSLTLVNGGSADVGVEIVEARLQGAAGLTSFPVSPTMVTVPAMTSQAYGFVKNGPGIGTRGCDWCSPTDTQLVVELLVDGVSRAFTDSIDSVSCSF